MEYEKSQRTASCDQVGADQNLKSNQLQSQTMVFGDADRPGPPRLYSALEIHNARRPEQLYFGRKQGGSNNFSNQLALTALFDET